MNLSSIVASFATGTYTVTRQPRNTFDTNGDPVAPASSTFNMRASVQPTTGRDLQRLPEGLRSKEILAVFTTSELKVTSSSYEPDVVAVEGFTYQVESCENWNTAAGYYKALISKVEP